MSVEIYLLSSDVAIFDIIPINLAFIKIVVGVVKDNESKPKG